MEAAYAELRRGYFLRPLRFAARHMPFYFTRLKPAPAELLRGLSRFRRYFHTRPRPEDRLAESEA